MRLLGLDYGSKTVGVAVTDPLGYTAQPLETITRKEENKLRRTLARIEQLEENTRSKRSFWVIQSIWTDQQESVQSLRLRLKQC